MGFLGWLDLADGYVDLNRLLFGGSPLEEGMGECLLSSNPFMRVLLQHSLHQVTEAGVHPFLQILGVLDTALFVVTTQLFYGISKKRYSFE